MSEHHPLHLDRGHVLTAGLDDVLDPVLPLVGERLNLLLDELADHRAERAVLLAENHHRV
jgi:hypothetical protein